MALQPGEDAENEAKDKLKPCPESSSAFLSRLTFEWFSKYIHGSSFVLLQWANSFKHCFSHI